MILFAIYGLLTKMIYDGDRRKKNPKYTKDGTKEKVGLTSNPHTVYEAEADCFSVSENTENKPDLP